MQLTLNFEINPWIRLNKFDYIQWVDCRGNTNKGIISDTEHYLDNGMLRIIREDNGNTATLRPRELRDLKILKSQINSEFILFQKTW